MGLTFRGDLDANRERVEMIAKPALRLAKRLYRKSPAENLARLQGILTPSPRGAKNDVLDQLLGHPSLPIMLGWKLSRSDCRNYLLLGNAEQIQSWHLERYLPHTSIEIREWDWELPEATPSRASELAGQGSTEIVICRAPTSASHWDATRTLRSELDQPVRTIGELLLSFTQVFALTNKLDYFLNSFEDILRIYLGHAYFGPLDQLDALFPLATRRVLEFGCFDGYQTLGLAHLGAEVTCVEARAENVVKTRAAVDAVGVSPVRICMDDFHNVTAQQYGRFDLAFAHGVYYHAVQPLLFLENLTAISDNIFVGGFCASDELPDSPWQSLADEHGEYRVKCYSEGKDFTAGVNDVGYFFEKSDLAKFFEQREYRVTVISDEPSTRVSGRYFRFLAQR